MTPFVRSCAAELSKSLTLPAIWLTAGGTVVGGVIVARAVRANAGAAAAGEPRILLTSIPDYLIVGFVVLGSLVATSEYSSRQITTSMSAVPRRARLLGSKFLIAIVLAGGLAIVSMVASRLCLPGRITGADLGTMTLIAIHLTLMTVICVAVGILLRETMPTVASCLGILVLAPPIIRNLTQAGQWLPSMASARMYLTDSSMHSAVVGALVALGWVAMCCGASTFRLMYSDA